MPKWLFGGLEFFRRGDDVRLCAIEFSAEEDVGVGYSADREG